MQNTLKLTRPVHLRRFMQFRIHSGKGRHINDRIPAHRLPDPGKHINMGKSRGRSQNVRRIISGNRTVNNSIQAYSGIKYLDDQTYHNDC